MNDYLTREEILDRSFMDAKSAITDSISHLTDQQRDAITHNVTYPSSDLVDQEIQELNALQADRNPHAFSVPEGVEEIAKLLGPDLSEEYGAELESSQGMELAQQFAAMSFDDDTAGKMVTMDGEQLEVAMDQTTQKIEMEGDRVAIDAESLSVHPKNRVAIDPSSMSIHPDNQIAIEFDESMVTDNNSTPGMSR